MRVSLEWLQDYVDITLSPSALAERLTLSGTKVEGIITIGEGWDDILIGRIVRLEPHPNADRLQLCTLSLGEHGEQTVATGAFNITVGDRVPYIGVGGRLPDGSVLQARPMRGFVSTGMVLAEDELALGDDHAGIFILGSDAPEGQPLRSYLGDTILDLEITPNRPDCLSMIGVAREVAALTGQQLRLPAPSNNDAWAPNVNELVRIQVHDPDLCPRFTATAVSTITIGPSPFWLARRVRAAGIRSINNIVDVSNYVMLEWGQPLHTYDLERLSGRQIHVRRAQAQEQIVTLDGQTRSLNADMLIIADANDPVGVAGVMGAANSDIVPSTQAVLIEAASFAGPSIRRAGQVLGLRSEASSRFEKGLPWSLPALAQQRAASLVAEVGGGTLHEGMVDIAALEPRPRTIVLPIADVSRLLGIVATRADVVGRLTPLGFLCADAATPDHIVVTVPDWRNDVQEGADLVEEVARQIGFDNLPTTLLRGSVVAPLATSMQVWDARLRTLLLGLGLSECFSSYTMLGDADLLALLGEGATLTPNTVASLAVNPSAVTARGAGFELLRMINPLTPERSVMRPTMLANLVATLRTNLRHTSEEIAFFELGRCYFPRPHNADLPYERRTLGIALAGLRAPRSWHEQARSYDFYDLKGIVEAILLACGLREAAPEHPTGYRVARRSHPLLHPGRAAQIVLAEGQELAFFGEIHPALNTGLDLDTQERCLVLEMDADLLVNLASAERRFSSISRFPPTRRDIALVVRTEVPTRDVLDTIKQAGAPLLADLRLFDVYTGEQVPTGHRSLACALTFQAHDHTLHDAEVDAVYEAITTSLSSHTGGQMRAL